MRLVMLIVSLAAVAGIVAVAAAQTGVPAEIAAYRSWTKMNAALLTDPSNPRAGPKNTFTNLTPAQLRSVFGAWPTSWPGGRLRTPFPEGTILVRESLDVAAGFTRVLFVMKKDAKAGAKTGGWIWSGLSRAAADAAFQPLAVPDPVARCVNCHMQMGSTDLVFQPFTNRERAPLPAALAADRVDALNYQFAPQALRVKVGATVSFVNLDKVPHDIKAADRSFESGNLPVQDRFFFTFSKPGTFEYFCSIHLEMRGRVIVEP